MQLLNLANILTLLNLLSGCFAIVFIFSYQVELVPWCILVSLIADFLDGFAARLNKKPTELGKQLDSLADVVSFGLLPGIILFQLLFQKFSTGQHSYSNAELYLFASPGFFFTLCAALRLGKFNIDSRQSNGFLGLATPAATIFVLGYLLTFLHNSFGLAPYVFDPYALYAVTIVLCALMVSEIPMFAFKFKSIEWKGNEAVFVFIILSLILFATLKFVAICLVIALYVIISVVNSVLKKENKT